MSIGKIFTGTQYIPHDVLICLGDEAVIRMDDAKIGVDQIAFHVSFIILR